MRLLELLFTFVIGLVLITSIAGFILDRPILISYVYSDSMSPTLEKGDLFFINPLSKGDVNDIIVFKMNNEWTVHRIYVKDFDGYITKGDNNVATDQQEGKNPKITKDAVIGKVITIGGEPLKIPRAGDYISSLSKKGSNLYVAIAFLVIGAILLTTSSEERKRKKKRRKYIRVKFKTLYAVTASLTVAVLILSMMLSWGTLTFSYSSTLASGQREGWYLPGSMFEEELTLKNRAIYPFLYFIEPQGDRIEILSEKSFKISGGNEKKIKVQVSVPEDTRVYGEKINVYAYLPILPERIITELYYKSPYLPFIAYIAEASFFLTLLYFAVGAGSEDIIKYRVHRSKIFDKLRESVGL
ncbi:signal peptidase I [Thermococcus sp. M39]|uniref:signal peptidase I n=1 Tax=unclassified Thermococcus TaxID=2627626 RepID=UPI00143AF1E4|nr:MULTISPECIES: signal peptidase I [unclassified Thermococcus]NJE09197.1 signal peptidase I [Thermococcus sp. M39]NJE13767.1 signal peptidase I [Thermococcus sp. LS2]